MVINLEKTCPICKNTYTLKHPNQKYCTSKCKIIARKRQIKTNVQRYRTRYRNTQKQARHEAIGHACHEHGKIIMEQYHIGKGTGGIGATPENNFQDEIIAIEKEKRRLKIKT